MGAADILKAVQDYWKIYPPYPPNPVEIKNASRDQLGDFFRTIGFNRGAELGCWEGWNAMRLCKGNPDLHLICVDAWLAHAQYEDHKRPQAFVRAEEAARKRLAPYNVSIMRMFTDEAAPKIPDRSLDFVYIDANHTYESVTMDLFNWVPKVKPGGIVCGHDFEMFPRNMPMRVVEAVMGYTAAHDIAPLFVLGRRRTLKGELRDKERSFLWVKT